METKAKERIIRDSLGELNWTFITACYHQLNLLWLVEDNSKGFKSVREVSPSENDLRDELRRIISYVIDNDIEYTEYGHWTIQWKQWEDTSLGKQLEILFTPTRSVIFEKESESGANIESKIRKTKNGAKRYELLNYELDSALKNEDYEKAALLRDEIKKWAKYVKKA